MIFYLKGLKYQKALKLMKAFDLYFDLK